MMATRPLWSLNIDGLERYSHSNKFSLEAQKEIQHELRYRSSYPRQVELRSKVAHRISQLKGIHELLQVVQINSTGNTSAFWRWFYEKGDSADIFDAAVIHGVSFLPRHLLVNLLERNGISYCGYYRGDVETLIIGKSGWNEEDVKQQLDLRTGKSIRVYSEEMVLAFLRCGKDPLNGGDALLRYFCDGHPGLEFLLNLGFPWPSTEAFLGVGNLIENGWPQEGLLGHMGYHVGLSGASRSQRQKILERVFKEIWLPKVWSEEYLDEWGEAESADRLRKIAESIASFAKNMKRKSIGKSEAAIKDWEEDLDWLKVRFYTGRFRFRWPDTLG